MADIPLESAVVCWVPANSKSSSKYKGSVLVYAYGTFELDILPPEFRQAGASMRSWRFSTPREQVALLNALFVQLVVQYGCQGPVVARAFSFIPEFRAQWGLAAPEPQRQRL